MPSSHVWNSPPVDPALQPGEVHVWRAFLDNYASRLADLRSSLSEDERSRAGRFHFARDQVHFTVGRGFLRSIVARYLRQEPAQLRFGYGSNGKPFLATPLGNRSLQFNLSHSHGIALLALAFRGMAKIKHDSLGFAFARCANGDFASLKGPCPPSFTLAEFFFS